VSEPEYWDKSFRDCGPPDPTARLVRRRFTDYHVELVFDDGVHVQLEVPDEIARRLADAHRERLAAEDEQRRFAAAWVARLGVPG
jgi:hypothetical protein